MSLLVAHAAFAQTGDPTRGDTLYHSTYKCTDCHVGALTPSNAVKAGATVAGLLNAIDAIADMSQRYSLTLASRPTDLVDVAAYIAQATGSTTPTGTINVNQRGLTGSWYQPSTSGQGMEVEIFPNLAAGGSGVVQVSWFTFDSVAGGSERQRWYTLGGPVSTGQPASLTIYQNVGGNFNAAPITTAQAIGSATLSFDSCTSGQLAYQFSDGSGRSGSIPLTRITQNVTCSAAGTSSSNRDFGLSGNWYDPATSGQGITVEVNPNSDALFLAWYTYSPSGASAGASGQRWYTAQGSFAAGARAIPLQIYQTTGGVFNAVSPAPATVPVGTGVLSYQTCNAATLGYTFTGGASAGLSGTIALTRVGPIPADCAP
jgi:hypothetical protein